MSELFEIIKGWDENSQKGMLVTIIFFALILLSGCASFVLMLIDRFKGSQPSQKQPDQQQPSPPAPPAN